MLLAGGRPAADSQSRETVPPTIRWFTEEREQLRSVGRTGAPLWLDPNWYFS